jgi:hypothetical protein
LPRVAIAIRTAHTGVLGEFLTACREPWTYTPKNQQDREVQMSAQARAQRDAGLARLRSLNAGIVLAGVGAIGLASAGVAVAAPSHRSSPPTGGQSPATSANSGTSQTANNPATNVQQPPQQVNPNTNPPVVTSGGS